MNEHAAPPAASSTTSTPTPAALRPMLWVVDRLRLSARLVVLAVVLLVPGLLSSWSFASAMTGQIDFAHRESTGVDVVHPALTAMVATAAGEDADVAGVAKVARASGLDVEDPVVTLEQVMPGPTEARDRTEALGALITAVGDSSKLILDPDLDSFYTMDIQVVQLPKLLLAVSAVRGLDAADDTLAAAQARAVLAGQVSSAADALEADASTAARVSPELEPKLQGVLATVAASRTLASALAGGATTVDAAPVVAAAAGAVDPAVDALDGLLGARADGLGGRRNLRLWIAMLGFVLALWFGAASWWRTRRDVGLTVDAVAAIAAGDLEPHELPAGRDEVADIGRSLDTARGLLVEQRDDLAAAHAVREDELQRGFEQRRAAELQVRERAQTIIDDTARAVIGELEALAAQVDAVRAAAGAIEERVTRADSVTQGVVEQARVADRGAVKLGESLRDIASVTQLIGSVADQTQLLSLNAAIEAARAGQAGQGFSVVADEVKSLAVSSAGYSEQIDATIATLQRDATDVAQAITSVGGGIAAVDEATGALRGVATDQFAVVEELERVLAATIERVGTMSTLTERLERRGAERHVLTGTVDLQIEGREPVEARLLDLSTSGLRCSTAVPMGMRPGRAVRATLHAHGLRAELSALVVREEGEAPATDIGLTFVGLDASVLATLVDICDQADAA